MSEDSTFRSYLVRRKNASDAFVDGNVDPLLAVSTESSPATIFGPNGTCVQGAADVNAANARGASMFQPGGTNEFETVHLDAGESLAYCVGVQRSKVRMRDREDVVSMQLRVTEIFRREGDDWKLIHRHADQLAESSSE